MYDILKNILGITLLTAPFWATLIFAIKIGEVKSFLIAIGTVLAVLVCLFGGSYLLLN